MAYYIKNKPKSPTEDQDSKKMSNGKKLSSKLLGYAIVLVIVLIICIVRNV